MTFKKTEKTSDIYSRIKGGYIPAHVALIMDGNGRWAKQHHLGRIRGHRRGVASIRQVVRTASKLGISYITVYAFSTENWTRPKEEVEALWNLLIEFLEKELPDLKKNNVKISAIGKLSMIPEHVKNKLFWAIDETKNESGLVLNLALNYGGRDEITDAFKSIIESGDYLTQPINADLIENHLYTKNIPSPDLMIRTSGECRLSNFLLWQLSYTELYFTPVLWPDFGENDFLQAIEIFQGRNRRFGGI